MSSSPLFDLVLFSVDPDFIRPAVQAGVTGIIVDWESADKASRQANFDTQINEYQVDDLIRVREATSATVICRINGFGASTADEVTSVLEAQADELLLPMVRTVSEVETVLEQVAGRCGVGILVETVEAVGITEELARLPLSRVYVGLNDLAIERETPNIFTAVADGTVEEIRHHFTVPFGFGGLTLPEGGAPIPCRLLIAEMMRLKCDFSFLRRSFFRDIQNRGLRSELARLHQSLQEHANRSPEVVIRDHDLLKKAIAMAPPPTEWPFYQKPGAGDVAA